MALSDLPILGDAPPRDLSKPEKGSHWRDGRERRKAVSAHEDAEKAAVRARDKICRWPHCEHCRRYHPRLEVAHIHAKGMGGDHGTRSHRSQMVLLDWLTHQCGASSLEQHGRRIEVLHPELGTAGPLAFWATDEDGREYLVAREVAPFVYEHD